MQAYLGGQSVSITIPLVSSDSDAIAAQSVSYRVIDQNETELIAKTLLGTFAEGDSIVTVAVDAAFNTLATGTLRGLRVIELYLTTESGTIKLESSYFIEAEEVLVEGTNSFQGYGKAIYLACELPNIVGWADAAKESRIAALIAARRNIGQLRFRYIFDTQDQIIDTTVGVSDLTRATLAQWLAMPTDFKDAIRRAQILEADFLLGGDAIGEYRRNGLMSMTTGEAKQFFRPVKAVEGVVCRRVMKELSKYVLVRTRLTRG